MTKHRDFATLDVFPAGFLDALTEFLGSYASATFVLDKSAGTTVRVQAGSGNAQVALAINGQWRFISSNVTATVPGGTGAGVYPIYVTSQANNAAQEDAGTFDYSFGLKLVTAPTGTGAETISRTVGTFTFDGTAITAIQQDSRAGGYKQNGISFPLLTDGAVQRRFATGQNLATPSGLGSQAGHSTLTWQVAHGLKDFNGAPAVPLAAWANARSALGQNGGSALMEGVAINVSSWDATNLTFVASIPDTSNNGFPYDWFAIY